ncbi:hypothetical protein H1R20_g7916, partial [Candolleomyces eurysporus]
MGVHVSTAHALLIQSKLPTSLWAEVICFSVWLHNRQFTTSVLTLKTPYKIVTRSKPNLLMLHPWEAKVLVKDPKATLHFPQEDDNQPGEYAANNNVVLPPSPPPNPPPSQPSIDYREEDGDNKIPPLMEDLDDKDNRDEEDDEEIEKELLQGEEDNTSRMCRNVAPPPGFYTELNQEAQGRGAKVPQPYTPKEAALAALITEINKILGQEGVSVGANQDLVSALTMAMAASQDLDSPTFEEAMAGEEKEKWMEAIREEMAQIEKMHTYDVVEVD